MEEDPTKKNKINLDSHEKENSEEKEKVFLGKTADGAEVYDREDSHLHEEGGLTPAIVKSALAVIDTEGDDFLKEEVVFEQPIGEQTCVEVGPKDEVVMVYRKGRSGQTPMVKNRQANPCDSVMAVLKRDLSNEDKNSYELLTAYIGKDSPREPWDPNLQTEGERQECQDFWNSHAIVYDDNLIDWERTKEFESMPEAEKQAELMRQKTVYAGLFVDPEELNQKVQPRLDKVIEVPHVTTAFRPTLEQLNLDQIGSQAKITAVGYGNDGKNEGLLVKIKADDPEVQKACDALETPHITLSLGENGQAKNTALLKFTPLDDPIELTGTYGLFSQGKTIKSEDELKNSLGIEDKEPDKDQVEPEPKSDEKTPEKHRPWEINYHGRDLIKVLYKKHKPTFDDLNDHYPPEKISWDKKTLERIKKNQKQNTEQIEGVSDAQILEKAFCHYAMKNSWFGDNTLHKSETDSVKELFFPTSEYDDRIHHVDVISAIKNDLTGGKTIPFAFDLTYNIDKDDLAQKFRWKHSSLGANGFASADYFKDKISKDEPVLPEGEIDPMPRFIIGFDPTVAVNMAGEPVLKDKKDKSGSIDEKDLTIEDAMRKETYEKEMRKYLRANDRAKWTVLFECLQQAEGIKKNLQHIRPGAADRELLATANEQIDIVNQFFENAIRVAAQKIIKVRNKKEGLDANEGIDNEERINSIIREKREQIEDKKDRVFNKIEAYATSFYNVVGKY